MTGVQTCALPILYTMLFENLSLAVADNDFYNHSHSGFASHNDVNPYILYLLHRVVFQLYLGTCAHTILF